MSGRPAGAVRRRGRGRQARRPGPAVPRPLAGRLPRAGRLLALVLLTAFVGAALALANGPWLRIQRTVVDGTLFTPARAIDAVLGPLRGQSLLTLDSTALIEELSGLPAVASVEVTTSLPDVVDVRIEEKAPAFVWQTTSARLVGAADGTIIASLARGSDLEPDLAGLPLIDDQRAVSAALGPGDAVNGEELRMALEALAVDPVQLGSTARRVEVRFADEYGLMLVSQRPAWRAALGVYGLDPTETPEAADARFAQQLAAIRTLFATRGESDVTWADVRNPGKVYWAP